MKVASALGMLGLAIGYMPLAFGHEEAHDEHHIEYNTTPMNDDWASKHMAEEHHINTFDAAAFFSLHDYDSNGEWTRDEIMKTYGLKDVSNRHVSAQDKNAAVDKVLALFDRDRSGTISLAEYIVATESAPDHNSRVVLPDLGFGPGHHGDDEYEYEIHHFEKFHGEHSTEADLVHPEDVEHFKHHDEIEDKEAMIEMLDKMPVVEKNIPPMF